MSSDQPRNPVATGHPEQGASLTGWQPIETAPKDGTHVLAVCITPTFDEDTRRTYDDRTICVAYWLWGSLATYPYSGSNPQGQHFTHWMPLPPPPENPQ